MIEYTGFITGGRVVGSLSIWHWLIVFLFILIPFIPLGFYVRSYQRAAAVLNSSGGNAPMASVWLLFVPIVGIAWYFVLLFKLREAIALSKISPKRSLWWTYGLIAGSLYVVSFIGFGVSSLVGLVLSVAWLTFGIMHWIELNALRRELRGSEALAAQTLKPA
jgi:hypothetical protein